MKYVLAPFAFVFFVLLIALSIPMFIMGMGLDILGEREKSQWFLENSPAIHFIDWEN